MSVLRIKAYHSTNAIENGINYTTNKEKTDISSLDTTEMYKGEGESAEETLDLNAINAFTYSMNPNKTDIGTDGDVELLVTGIGCKPNTASEEFIDDMNLYYANGHKEDLAVKRAKRLMKVRYDEKGEPIRDSEGNIVYDENGTVYRDPATGKCIYQEYMKQSERCWSSASW